MKQYATTIRALEECEPVLEDFPGWHEDLTEIERFEAFPQAAKNYVQRIAALTGVPVALVSVGLGASKQKYFRTSFNSLFTPDINP